jgi:hypothetical protein
MLRVTALLCAAMLMQAMAARTLLEHSACRSACSDDAGSDGGYAGASDEALAARRVVIEQPAPPRQSRWDGPELSAAPSPAPDEILHVPKPLLA